MPLVKRSVAPRHLCHGAVPEGVGSELECVTNNTLSAIIRQLSSLSKHAENVFGEIFNEANTFYVRANSLKDRIDRLAVKVIELDSSVEEVSLQDINMRKAFKSATVQDQQVVTKSSASNPVSEMYSSSDKTPPLNTFTAYREDRIDAVKFYTDPSYFFDFWKEKILQDTEEKRKEHRRQREQKRCVDTSTHEGKKARRARTHRQEWNVFHKELCPDHLHPHTLRRRASSEGSLSPDGRPDLPDYPIPPGPAQGAQGTVPGGNTHPSPPGDHEYYSIEANYRGEGTNGICLPPADYSPVAVSTTVGLPPPCRDLHISSAQTTFGSTLGAPVPLGYPLPPVPLPPPVPPATPSPLAGHNDSAQLVGDARSDLLSAIRMGIQLKKVQELQEQQSKQEPVGNDVATILSRRIALEYSDSEEDSELDYNEWSD